MRPTPPLLVLALLAHTAVASPQEGADARRPILEDQHRLVPGDSESDSALSPGDLDGDGDLDFVVGTLFGPGVLRNEGQSRFVRVDGVFRGPCNCRGGRAAVGALNADDRVDVFVDGTPFFNDGSGGFEAGPSPFPPLTSLVAGVVLADVEGDGDLDALLTTSSDTWLALNDGAGGFADASQQVPAVGGRSLAVSDLDLDGDPDLVIGPTTILLNDGNGVFTEDPTATPPVSVAAPRTVVGDFDGDGFDDLFLGEYDVAPYIAPALLLNDGTARFVDASANLPDGGSPLVVAGDLEGDGDLDLAFADPPLVFLNDGAASFVADDDALPPEPDAYTTLLVGADVDRDRDFDLLSITGATFSTGRYRLLLNDGNAGFLDTALDVQPARFSTLSLELADLDGDGDLDALGSRDAGAMLWIGDGAGAMSETSGRLPGTVTGSVFDVALGDVDADGDVDALWPQYGQNRLFANDGAAVFTDETARLPVESDAAEAALLADLDGDGDLDAFIGNRSGAASSTQPAPDALWRNDGTGVFFDDSGALPALSRGTLSLAVGDVDGDGDLDVLAGNGGQNTLYRNDDTGAFEDATADLPPEDASNWTRDVELGDLDGDGDLDAYYANLGGSTCVGCYESSYFPRANQVVLNDGDGRFTDDPARHPNGGVCWSAELDDFDGDGDLDVVVGNGPWLRMLIAPSELYLNDGTGALAPPLPYGQPSLPGDAGELSYTSGDLDGDGDVDVFSGRRVWTNITRSLAWSTLARLGRPLELVLWGEPGGPYLLAGAWREASIPLGPLGTLALDPDTILFTTSGSLDERGQARRSFRVPETLALAGHTIHWQALVGPEPRFTNREPTTVYPH